MPKKFDFEHTDFKGHLPDQQKYLLENYDKPITEEEFVKWWTARPRVKTNGDPIRHASKQRSPARGRRVYRRLKENYGLFQG